MLFIGMHSKFMQLILQTCPWLKSNKFNHLGDGNQYHPEMEASHLIDVISDSDSKSVGKTFLFLQTCTTKEYDWIKMLVLTDDFSRVASAKWTVYFLFTAHLETGRWLIRRHFHTPM